MAWMLVWACACAWKTDGWQGGGGKGTLRPWETTHRGHDVLSEMGVGVFPGGAVLDDLVGAGGSEFGYHEPRCGGGYDDSALEVESACRVNSSEPGIAATGGENMRPRSLGEFLEPAKKVVADASV